jgi:hypothetical protein
MVRILRDVKRIVIHPMTVAMLTPTKWRDVYRENWDVCIEGIKQVQNVPADDIVNLFMEEKVNCRIDAKNKVVHCGRKPQNVQCMRFVMKG